MTPKDLGVDSRLSLASRIQKMKEEFAAGLSPEVRQTMGAAMERLLASDVASNAKGVGDVAPDFSLPNAWGGMFRLSDRLQAGPVVLCFYRGGWCPYCNLEFEALHEILPRIRALGATLVALSPQTLEHSDKTAAELGLDFPVLSDRGNTVARRYGLVMTLDTDMRPLYKSWGMDLVTANGDRSFELPVPATYVIDRAGMIRAAFVDKDYTRRMEPSDVLVALEEIGTQHASKA